MMLGLLSLVTCSSIIVMYSAQHPLFPCTIIAEDCYEQNDEYVTSLTCDMYTCCISADCPYLKATTKGQRPCTTELVLCYVYLHTTDLFVRLLIFMRND